MSEPTPAAATTFAAKPGSGGPCRTVGVAGLGMALPPHVVDNAEVSAGLGIDDAWIVRRMGIHARRRAAPETTLADLATEAGQAALQDSGRTADDIDLLLVATLDELATPNAAPIVAHALGAERAGTFDVGCACTGWVAAVGTACAWIEAGRAETALVIGAELMSRHTDPADKRTAPLFGDAAGAAVFSAGAAGTIGPVILGADGSCAEMITTDRTSGFILMDGHETFKQAVSRLAQASRDACAAAGVELSEIDLLIYHQANARITTALGERLELDPARVVDCIGQLGYVGREHPGRPGDRAGRRTSPAGRAGSAGGGPQPASRGARSSSSGGQREPRVGDSVSLEWGRRDRRMADGVIVEWGTA